MKAIATVLAIAVLSGCATTGQGYGAAYNPIVDRPGPNYSVDLSECQQLATRVLSAGDSAVGGAVAGAIFGALLSAAVGGGSRYQNNYMAAGALSGAAKAAESAEGGQRGIITRCLSGRGYAVLQ